MVAIFRHQLSGVALVPTSTTSGVGIVIVKDVLGAKAPPSVYRWGASSSVELPTCSSKVSSSSFPSAVPPEICGQVSSHVSMHIVATLYYHNNAIVPPFVIQILHEMRHRFVEPKVLGCNGNILQTTDGTPPRVTTTTSARGPTSVVMASIAKSGAYIGGGTGGIDLGRWLHWAVCSQWIGWPKHSQLLITQKLK